MPAASSPAVRVGRLGRRRALGVGGLRAATAYVYAVDPSQPGRFLPCPILATTGFFCPGCGGLRSAHALLHGDVLGSLGFNPLVLVSIVVGFAGLLAWHLRGRPPLRMDPSGWAFRSIIVGLVAFTVLRNIPGWAWLSPA